MLLLMMLGVWVRVMAITVKPSDELLDIRQLSEWLGVAKPTLYAWRHKGQGPPAIKLNGRVRFRRADVETWIEAQREQR